MTDANERHSSHHEAEARSDLRVYFDEAGAAKYLGLEGKARRLKDLRTRGGGPRYVRVGQTVRYCTDWLDAWAEQNAVSSTSQESARRRA